MRPKFDQSSEIKAQPNASKHDDYLDIKVKEVSVVQSLMMNSSISKCFKNIISVLREGAIESRLTDIFKNPAIVKGVVNTLSRGESLNPDERAVQRLIFQFEGLNEGEGLGSDINSGKAVINFLHQNLGRELPYDDVSVPTLKPRKIDARYVDQKTVAQDLYDAIGEEVEGKDKKFSYYRGIGHLIETRNFESKGLLSAGKLSNKKAVQKEGHEEIGDQITKYEAGNDVEETRYDTREKQAHEFKGGQTYAFGKGELSEEHLTKTYTESFQSRLLFLSSDGEPSEVTKKIAESLAEGKMPSDSDIEQIKDKFTFLADGSEDVKKEDVQSYFQKNFIDEVNKGKDLSVRG